MRTADPPMSVALDDDGDARLRPLARRQTDQLSGWSVAFFDVSSRRPSSRRPSTGCSARPDNITNPLVFSTGNMLPSVSRCVFRSSSAAGRPMRKAKNWRTFSGGDGSFPETNGADTCNSTDEKRLPTQLATRSYVTRCTCMTVTLDIWTMSEWISDVNPRSRPSLVTRPAGWVVPRVFFLLSDCTLYLFFNKKVCGSEGWYCMLKFSVCGTSWAQHWRWYNLPHSLGMTHCVPGRSEVINFQSINGLLSIAAWNDGLNNHSKIIKHTCVSRTDTNPPFPFQIAFPWGTDFTGFLQRGSKSYTYATWEPLFLAVAEI